MESKIFEWLCTHRNDQAWGSLCEHLLQTELLSDPYNPHSDEVLMERPFYRTIARTLDYCLSHQGQLPPDLRQSPWPDLLPIANADRLETIEKELAKVIKSPDSNDTLEIFLFQFLKPVDWRVFLGLRTTTGGQDLAVMPPSLSECWASFGMRYVKSSALPSLHPQNNILTLGAKALSKHWHRDRNVGFWGICTGTEQRKNDHANHTLLRILRDAVWVNLHRLPVRKKKTATRTRPTLLKRPCYFKHEYVAFEVRQRDGYGVRWSRALTEPVQWHFRGFLEPPMKDGHDKGWVH